jgi:tRNA-specific 2-thiouridylase
VSEIPESNQAGSVVVGLSGGVDSAVAALLLQQQGFQVSGLFMKNWDEDDGTEYCTAITDLADAQQVAEQLGIELHTANFAAEYWDNVFAEFLSEYKRGRTPNPDILCNREIKFKQFVDYADSLGADYIATGHYARMNSAGQLHKAADGNKDQTYFLQAVPQAQLAKCLFPLGDLQKTAVREQAANAGFANHGKKDSTGICFIGERRFEDFLARYLPAEPGPMVDEQGVTLGQHRGLQFYTLGQRQGLGIGGRAQHREAPWFVLDKDLSTQTLVVTQDQALLNSDWLAASQLNWLSGSAPPPGTRLQAKVRYRQPDQMCQLFQRADGLLGVNFDELQRAVTPGQYVCFYAQEQCLGGGVIERVGYHG